MTATAQQVESTPMAPYIGLMRGMSRHDIQIVVKFLNEVMEEQPEEKATPSKTNTEIIREKYKNLKKSPRIKWYRGCMSHADEWNTQKAWEELTDEQRQQAERLNLTSEDMDARTFSILTKWIQ